MATVKKEKPVLTPEEQAAQEARIHAEIDRLVAQVKAAQAKYANYTQSQVGVLLGYTGESAEVSVRRWESNARPVPIEKLRKLAEVLHLTLDDLIP